MCCCFCRCKEHALMLSKCYLNINKALKKAAFYKQPLPEFESTKTNNTGVQLRIRKNYKSILIKH